METLLIPQADTIPVSWGWFQFLLMLTFPLHLLAMNAMVGGLILGLYQHIRGGMVREQLAHRIAVVTPLLIATVVNLGVAPFLFVQVLYGQFVYTSSVLIGFSWIMVVPVLILAYYAAYIYDFKFEKLGKFGILVGIFSALVFLFIGFMFSNNMLLMVLPERFAEYFQNMCGSMLVTDEATFVPRYLHMMLGALAVGGLAVALLGNFQAERDLYLAEHAKEFGMKAFLLFTSVNVVIGLIYLLTLPKEQMMLFMGRDMGATISFSVGLLLTIGVIVSAIKRKLALTVTHVVMLVYVMSFMRAWLRSDYLQDVFTLDKLQVVPQYSSMVFFFVTLVFGLICLAWLWSKTKNAMKTY